MRVMSNREDEQPTDITDEDLPEELQPTDDNPLAKPLDERDDPKSPEELDVLGGKEPEQHAEERDDARSDDD